MKTRSFLLTALIGLFLIGLAALGLYTNLSDQTYTKTVYYEIGEVLELKGYVKKIIKKDKVSTSNKSDKVFSNQVFEVGKDSMIKFKLAEEVISIFGPSSFSFNLVDPSTKEIFINFAKFESVLPFNKSFEHIKLTYNGWQIESFFKSSDLNTDKKQDFKPDSIDTDKFETDDEDLDISNENKSSKLEEAIAIKRPLLKKCYENYLKENPLATGKLVVEFSLQPSGRVSSTRIKDSSFFQDSQFKKCIQNVFSRVKISPFNGQAILVSYPIEFE